MDTDVTDKTDDLLDAGVEKVIWILTESENVLIAEPDKHWIMARWSDTIEDIDEITLNLEQLVQTLARTRKKSGRKRWDTT